MYHSRNKKVLINRRSNDVDRKQCIGYAYYDQCKDHTQTLIECSANYNCPPIQHNKVHEGNIYFASSVTPKQPKVTTMLREQKELAIDLIIGGTTSPMHPHGYKAFSRQNYSFCKPAFHPK